MARSYCIGDKFGYNAVVFPAAGLRIELAKVVHVPVDADEGAICGLVAAVFWKLFAFVGHKFL